MKLLEPVRGEVPAPQQCTAVDNDEAITGSPPAPQNLKPKETEASPPPQVAAEEKAARRTEPSKLIIGWRLARDLGIEWFDHGRNHSHGNQPPNMLEYVSAEAVAMHTAVIAKSGSGKSFFLGRYLEEVLLRTGATVTIFDPNADFRKFKEVDAEVWKHHEGDKVTDPSWKPCGKKRPPLPHEREISMQNRVFFSGAVAAILAFSAGCGG